MRKVFVVFLCLMTVLLAGCSNKTELMAIKNKYTGKEYTSYFVYQIESVGDVKTDRQFDDPDWYYERCAPELEPLNNLNGKYIVSSDMISQNTSSVKIHKTVSCLMKETAFVPTIIDYYCVCNIVKTNQQYLISATTKKDSYEVNGYLFSGTVVDLFDDECPIVVDTCYSDLSEIKNLMWSFTDVISKEYALLVKK